MSGRIKIKPKNKDKKPKIDVFKVIEDRFKNMNELRDLIDMDPKSFGTKLFYTGGRSIDIPAYQWVHVMASWRKGHLREYIGGVLNYEDATNVMYTRNYQTYYFNIGGYPSAYDMGLPGMFRYVRIWNYAKNFDLDKFVPDT